MAGVLSLVRIRTGEKCISVPAARVLVSPKGLFARDIRLPRGTPVVVQLCDGQHLLTLSGTVSTSDANLGVAIEFKQMTEIMSRRLAVLLDAQRS